MEYGLAERSRSRDPSERIEITVEEMLSRQYIRFCPTDAWKPNINIYETDASIAVCVDIAGMKPQALHVEIDRNLLVLRGERPRPIPEHTGGTVGVHLMEIDTGGFCREVEVPETVDRGRVTAKYVDGFLWITLPKLK